MGCGVQEKALKAAIALCFKATLRRMFIVRPFLPAVPLLLPLSVLLAKANQLQRLARPRPRSSSKRVFVLPLAFASVATDRAVFFLNFY